MKKLFFLFSFAMMAFSPKAVCQVPDSLGQPPIVETQIDTLPHVGDSSLVEIASEKTDSTTRRPSFLNRLLVADYPNPNKALLLSAAIPGGGQLYNRRWWKAPIVWGGYVFFVYTIDFNTKNYRYYRDLYIAVLKGEPNPTNLRADDIKQIRDGYDKNKQLSYIGLFALHLVQTAEAFVDCHLKTFDVSDDISMKVKPTISSMATGETYFGVGVSFGLAR